MSYPGMIVGLGNPGTRYLKTRHNFGFMVMDCLLEKGRSVSRLQKLHNKNSDYILVGGWVAQKEWLFLKPFQFMNNSGSVVKKIVRKYGLLPEEILVIHDELDLPFMSFKFKDRGGLAGHNGLKSVAEYIGSKSFLRLRMGIGRPEPGQSGYDYVLKKFLPTEISNLPEILDQASEAVITFCERGLAEARSRHHHIGKNSSLK